jgi:3-oxoadipate enol-lactonase/4-carboxymuconolactone decarboxylase
VRVGTTDFGGSGPLLVLGPSLGTAVADVWGPVVPLLTGRFTVVGWDLPGHGGSPTVDKTSLADLAAAVLAAVDGPFSYAGVSLGGAVGLQLALAAPDRVRELTVFGTGAKIGEPAGWHERAELVRREGTNALRDGSRERWFAPLNNRSAVADRLVDGLAQVDAGAYAACCEALADHDLRPQLAAIRVPVIAVAGAHDPVTNPAALRHIATGVQRGRLVVLEHAGHLAPVEAPEDVAALIGSADADSRPSVAEVRARGMKTRREVLGDAHVDRASAGVDALTADFQDLITRYAWGDVWSRPGLDRRTRSMLTLALLAALGHDRELAMHVRAAVRNGVTPEEIFEVLLHTAVYAGLPVTNTALAIAREALS